MMNISVGNMVNFFVIALGIGVCSLNILQLSSTKDRLEPRVKAYFQFFFSLLLIYITSHLFRQLLEGQPGGVVAGAIRTVTLIEFLASGAMIFAFSILVLNITRREKDRKKWMIAYIVLVLCYFSIMCISQFGTWIYYFDSGNVYHRGSAYIVSNFAHVVFLALDAYLLLRYRKRLSKRIKQAMWGYVVAPFGAMVLQAFSAEVQFIIIATVAASVNLYAVIMKELTEQYEKQKEEGTRIETELNMAASIQTNMLPHIFPAFPERKEFEIYASMKPAKEVGGDFYDYYLLDDDHLALVIADVAGKGVPAALFMMISKNMIENYSLIYKSPKAVLEAINNQICKNNPESMFVTVWLGILELSTGRLTAANAGHEYPVLKQHGEDFELLKDDHGFVIGARNGMRYVEYEIKMKPDSKIFLYTDGLAEATNPENELFGIDNMLLALRGAQDKTPADILKAVDDSVNGFVNGAPQFDDLTMLCLHYKGSSGA